MATACLRDDKSKYFNTQAGALVLPGAEVEHFLPGAQRHGAGKD